LRLKFIIPLILIVGGAIRLLFLYTPNMDSDQAVTGLMARHILGGEFPFFFYGQDYCGSIEAYLASTVFFFLGATRFTLALTICLESLFFVLFIYYLARLFFDQGTAILSALFSALPSYYLIFHSVLARAAYIEIPIIGVLLFIVAHKIIYRNETSGRTFLVLGFFCGLGIWTHFLIVFYLAPIFLLYFIKDPWFWRRRTILFFLLGLALGGLPLWVHNIAHPLVTWHYLFDTSGGGEPALDSLKDFFLFRFPEALGVKNNDTNNYYIPTISFLLYCTYLALFLFLFLSRRKGLLNLFKLKMERSNGLDLLLLFLFLFPLIFSFSGFASGHTSRYLQPLFSVLPILFAVLTKKIKSISLVLASLFLVLHLFSNVYGTLCRLPLISKGQVTQYRQARENEQNLFKFLIGKNIKRLYSTEYWSSVRLTFDSQEEIIIAQPIGDRYPFFTALIDQDPGAAFLFNGDNQEFEETLRNIGGSYKKNQVFGFSVYYGFSPPPFRFTELSPTDWKVESNPNSSPTMTIFDRDLNTLWSTLGPQKPGDFLHIDLGKIVSDLGRVTLFSRKAEETPRSLRIEISLDGRHWQIVRETHGFWGSLSWSGPHPFYRPQEARIDLTFPPQPGRYVRLTQLGRDPAYCWSVSECFLYQAQPKLEPGSGDVTKLISFLKQIDSGRIFTTPWTQSQLPQDWRVSQKALGLDPEKEGLVQTLLSPVLVVEKEDASTLIHFLKNRVKQPYQEQEISGRWVFTFPTPVHRYQPLSSNHWRFQTNYNPGKANLAADGKLTTRWTTERPQLPGAFFQIELEKVERVARLRLLVGNSRNDFPRDYLIQSSEDGKTWSPLNPLLSPVWLHWTGETLLKGGVDLDFIFPPTPMRFLKIVQTGKDEVFYWSIHELELYQIEGNPKTEDLKPRT
jgi:4-amino-4-deoxy-L-arabinose transferase-like glycosyltransferase